MPVSDNTRSEEVKEIMNRVPPWITQFGIPIIVLIFLGILLIAYKIRYPILIPAKFEIKIQQPPHQIVLQEDGLIERLWVKNYQLVKPGDTLSVIKDIGGNNHFLLSSVYGKLFFSHAWEQNNFIKERTVVFFIMGFPNNYKATGNISISNIGKVKIGQKVVMELTSYPWQDYGIIEGKVSYISPVSSENNCKIDIDINQTDSAGPLITNTGKKIPLQMNYDANGNVVIDDKSILVRIIEKTLKRI